MRLFEIAQPKLFLGSKIQLELGSSMTPQGDTECLSPALESRLEAVRPMECIPRASSLYMLETSPGLPFVYQVEVTGGLDRQHTSWLRLLENADPRTEATLDEYVRGYWSGRESDIGDGVWEFRTEQAKVLRSVKSASRSEVNPTAFLQQTAADLWGGGTS